jgi:hypothetical protein
MRSITRLPHRLGLVSAAVVVTAGGFLLAGPGLGTSGTGGSDPSAPEPAPTVTADPRGPVMDAAPNPWEANDLVTLWAACSQPLADC